MKLIAAQCKVCKIFVEVPEGSLDGTLSPGRAMECVNKALIPGHRDTYNWKCYCGPAHENKNLTVLTSSRVVKVEEAA